MRNHLKPVKMGIIKKYACVLSHFSRVWLFVIPWTAAHQAPLSVGFPKQESWSGLPFPPPGDLPNPGIESVSLMFPALAGGFLESKTEGSGPPNGEVEVHWSLDKVSPATHTLPPTLPESGALEQDRPSQSHPYATSPLVIHSLWAQHPCCPQAVFLTWPS